MPIAFAEEPQPEWAVQLAFLLRTVELMTAIVAIIALVLLLGAWGLGEWPAAPRRALSRTAQCASQITGKRHARLVLSASLMSAHDSPCLPAQIVR